MSISPPGSKLDANQVLRRAYDEENNRLNVGAEVTATIGNVDVIIDASTDNIAISDGVRQLGITPSNEAKVNDSSLNTTATNILAKIGATPIVSAYDEMVITYVTAGNGLGEIETVVWKLSAVTQKTLTITYNIDNKVTNLVWS